MSTKTEKLIVGEYWDSWYRYKCPCGKLNWINNGDENDLTSPDVEAIKCWACKVVFRCGPIDELMEEIRGEDGQVYEENGIERPK